MKGLSGAAEKIKYSFDRDDELAFKAPVKYPQDLSMQQDHMTIQCYTYEPPYSAEFTKTDKTADGAGGSAVGAQRGSPFRMKIGAPIILPMPNNIQDTNQRVWEESSMNNQNFLMLLEKLVKILFSNLCYRMLVLVILRQVLLTCNLSSNQQLNSLVELISLQTK